VKSVLSTGMTVPVKVENDARAVALGEQWFGAARNVQNVVCMRADIGVGAGVILGGEVFTGAHYMAGEVGHAVVAPGGPKNTVRSALLLRQLVPHIEIRARQLKTELSELTSLRAEISQQREKVQGAGVAIEQERKHLAGLAARKRRLLKRTAAERQRIDAHLETLASQAKSLQDLIKRLEDEATKPPLDNAEPDEDNFDQTAVLPPQGLRPFVEGRGQITIPVAGRIVRVFDESAHGGTYNKGILVKTRPDAQVVSPYDGQVAFAGPFRGYGLILIIEHGEGYHTLLAGLRRIDSAVNQWLLAGEPVGVMGSSETGPSSLYMEIRLNGRPIDPLPWLAVDQAKVSG